MAEKDNVTLDARDSAASENPGFTDAVIFGGPAIHDYCYKFGGGSGDNPGDVKIKKDGHKTTFVVTLLADPEHYRINEVVIGNDPKKQFKVKSLSHTSVTIEDKNDELTENAYYSVILEDIRTGANGVLIACDPRISNVR
jgi:hypothetical protein